MAGSILNTATVTKCLAQGTVKAAPGNSKVLVDGQPVLTMKEQFTVPDCQGNPKPENKCARGSFTSPSTKVLASGANVLLSTSAGIGELFPHKFTVQSTQQRVFAN